MNLDIWIFFLKTVFIVSTTLRYSSADIHIDHEEENLITDIRNTHDLVFTSISENVDPDITKYENEAEVQIYLQKPAKETKEDKIVYSITKTRIDGSANWFSYATSKGSTREETAKLVKEPNETNESLDVKGTYSYVGNDGVRYIVGYTSGKNGYQAKVLFGTNVNIEEIPSFDVNDRNLGADDKNKKGFGGSNDLMCSLIGSGCL